MNNTGDLSWNQVLKQDFLSISVSLIRTFFKFDTMMSQIEKVRLSEKLRASLKTGFCHLLGSSLALCTMINPLTAVIPDRQSRELDTVNNCLKTGP